MTYELYSKDVRAGETVTIGMIAQGSCVNVIAAAVVYQATTEPPTEPTEPPTEPQPVTGDVDGSGTCDILDLIMLQKWVHGTGTLTDPDAADLNADGCVDVFDLALLKRLLLA